MVGQFHLVSAAGLLLGAHFGAWVVCIEDTSLSHALLAASCSPILIAIGTWILQKPISNGNSPFGEGESRVCRPSMRA